MQSLDRPTERRGQCKMSIRAIILRLMLSLCSALPPPPPHACVVPKANADAARRIYAAWRAANATARNNSKVELRAMGLRSTKDMQRACPPESCTVAESLQHGPYGRAPAVSVCESLVAFGNPGPQRKLACATPSLVESEDCVVISVGSENEWNFEHDIVQKTKCRVEVFDCTSAAARASPGGTVPGYARLIWSVPKHLTHRVRLHNKCLGTPQYRMLPQGFTIKGAQILSWPELLQFVGLNRSAPTLLKIDCEGCEVGVFRELMRHRMLHLLPQQIAVELVRCSPEDGSVQTDNSQSVSASRLLEGALGGTHVPSAGAPFSGLKGPFADACPLPSIPRWLHSTTRTTRPSMARRRQERPYGRRSLPTCTASGRWRR
jgi:hypothetical protein